MIESTVGRVAAGEDLTRDEMAIAIEAIMGGKCPEAEIATLLTVLRAKGETVAEIAGAATAMRTFMTPIQSDRTHLVDTCGTGGDASGTFNISTAAALVAAAAGVPVAKHGNRAVTSKSGSADVLRELGVNIDAEVATVEKCLDQLGLCFCFAPLMHGAMKHVAAVRKKLGVPTIFNMLGPLTNPAGAPFQVLGVGRPELRNRLAEALVMLGTGRSLVVCGEDGLDELTLGGVTHVTEATAQGLREFDWTPNDFGLETAGSETMRIANAGESAQIIRGILAGEAGPSRDIVVLNAAAALLVAGQGDSPTECAVRAADAIDGGAAAELLARLVEVSHS